MDARNEREKMAKPAKKDPRWSTANEAADQAKSWSDGVLQCRSGIISHKFDPYVAQFNPKLKYTYVVLRCKSCGTKKHMEINVHGQRIGQSWYTYEHGYQSTTGRIVGEAQDAVRAVALSKLFRPARMTAKEASKDRPRPSTLRLLQGGLTDGS